MATHDNGSSNALAELLDEQNRLSLDELARACCMQPDCRAGAHKSQCSRTWP